MKLLTYALSLGLASSLLAQSPLSTLPTPAPTQWYLWTGCPNPNMFFNLTINTTVTIQGLEVCLDNRAGQEGTIDVYVTNPGITTHVGSETNLANWTLRGSGPVTAVGQLTPTMVGLTPGIVLTPGSYGIAVRYNGVRAAFALGTGTNQNFSTAEMSFAGGVTQAQAFTSGVATPYIWYGNIHYANGNVQHGVASNADYGLGCNNVSGSFYQAFTCSGPASTALQGRALTLFFTGTGYIVQPAVGVSYIPPSASAASLPANDDGETMVALTGAVLYPGGFTQQLWVHTNGYVSVASNNVLNPTNYIPFVPGLLDAPQTAWYSWHDYNTAEAGSGAIKFEEVGSLAIITWDDVESWPALNGTTPVVNRSRFQFQFDMGTGQVNYVWQTITPQGLSLDGDQHVIGYSPGGPSPDVGPIDIATLTTLLTTEPEIRALKLDADVAPVLGSTVTYTTSNETGLNVGLWFVGFTQLPGLPLDLLGMPGCQAHVDVGASIGTLISNLGLPGTSMAVPFGIPTNAALIGAQLFSQSVWLDPTANAFGATVSNGMRTTIGNF